MTTPNAMIRIYLVTNKATNKRFVGFTHQKHTLSRIRHRLATDSRRFASTGNSPLLTDVATYGISAFSFTEIELCQYHQRPDRLAIWIAHFNCAEPHGYNRSKPEEPTP